MKQAQVLLNLADESPQWFELPMHDTDHDDNTVWLVFDLVISESGTATVNAIDDWGTTGNYNP